MTGDDDWEERWDARLEGMKGAFGASAGSVLHAAIPFEIGQDLGGSPNFMMFPEFTDGTLYVTADLIGSEQKPNSVGQYELAIAHREDEDWGVDLIAQLAYYTLENPIDDGETMDIGPAVPEGSPIEAFLFRRIAVFTVLGEPVNVIACVGITGPELKFCHQQGADALINKLGRHALVTEANRASAV